MQSEEHVSRTATSNTSSVLRETVPMTYHDNDDDESDGIFTDESDNSDQLDISLQKKNKSTPSGIKSLNGNAGVEPQENDIIISLTNKKYKDVLDPELDHFVRIREKGETPNVTESVEAMMNIFRHFIQTRNGRYLQRKTNPSRYVAFNNEDEVIKKIKDDLTRESRRRFNRQSTGIVNKQSTIKAKHTKLPSDDESDDPSSDESDYDSQSDGASNNRDSIDSGDGVKSPNGHTHVEPQQNDIVMSMYDEQYKEILDPELDKIVRMKERSETPKVKESADAIMHIFKKIIQGTKGRYLQLKLNPTKCYVVVDEDRALDKLQSDLIQFSRKRLRSQSFGDRKYNHHENQPPNPKKKSRLDDGWGCRPKRATRQLRDDMMYKEKMESTPNSIGRDVVEYTNNEKFNLKSLAVEEDKIYCIGQMIAKELIGLKGHRWAVKYCDVRGKSDFVTFKDCHNSNAQMAEALNNTSATSNGRAFVGYSELAQFMLQNGLLETSIKNTAEIKKMLKTFDIPEKNANDVTILDRASSATEQRHPTVHQSANTGRLGDGRADKAYDQLEIATRNSTSLFAQQKTDDERATNLRMTSIKTEQAMQLCCFVKEKLKSLKEGNAYGSDNWKLIHANSFYSSMRDHLVKQLNDLSLDASEFQDIMNNFEKAMEELTAEEDLDDNIDNIELAKSMIRYMIKGVEEI